MVRAEQWWDAKVAPLIGLAAVVIGSAPGPASAADLVDLALLLLSMVGVAAFGHLLNDRFDLEADAAAGKPNRLADLARGRRLALLAASLVLALAPWPALPHRPAAWAALAAELLLLVAYSAPPIRLKGRGWAGATADAAYAFALPFAIVVALFVPERPDVRTGLAIVSLVAFGILTGLRGILWHQIADLDADRTAGTATAVGRLGVHRSEALVARTLLPLEVASLAVALALGSPPWMVACVASFLVWRTFQVAYLWRDPVVLGSLRQPRRRVEVIGFEYVNHFIERWLPLFALVVLAWSSAWWWVAVAAFVVAFRNALRTFVAWDVWALPDAVERLVSSGQIRRDIRRVAQQRRDRLAAGAPPVADPTARRFAFVVCGPAEHLDTLSTALRHLRPLTGVELWLVTDPARNERPIEDPALDHIVEVATPPHLDDHQASIWLKTSVHRHLPEGTWCYLDSDIIAVSPGVEQVFDHLHGPIAFASDVTIRENAVDRFSPWAMTCECRGVGDQSSCSHLREQLEVRFGLDVPGDWLHWNGGVFAFGPEAAPILDRWHRWAVASFDWPEWRTRDQGTLIATAWSMGLQDLDRLPFDFNFIADLDNGDLCLDARRGWAHHPSGPWYQPKLLHLYTCPLDDPTWDLATDVEEVVIRRSTVRIHRWERGELRAKARHGATNVRWTLQSAIEAIAMRGSHLATRLIPSRIWRSARRRLGMDVSHVPIARPRLPDGDPRRAAR